jgi:phage baseplate assembly protein V
MSAASRTRSTDKRFYGVVEGIVTAVNDANGKEGRVKVQFPWFDDQMETEWCRVRQFYAGNGYGAFFVPEVGDEVLVAFVHGDMRLPVILGGLYNGKDKPPSHRDDSKDEKLIRTKGGHQIVLDDSRGAHKIVIRDSSNDNSVVIDTQSKTITVESKNGKIVLTANEIEISAQSTVTIKAQGTMDLSGQTININ